ncbi:hypothetical protein OSCT_3079 [Oscillochloris trichoides DG-6]|uniref:DUF4838 domain-containing protein n=1 Tax=Oscillochloris trichoides DG-6 TaxID=765420 RepID=E1IIC8_9CHLR|nr:DUF4838 domain-containing protein [Oscillochloris trichoides]EFO79078.1 hypothetical protein OSCT_3079 [Oscillochloris trichoides DG-6]
MDLTLTPRWAIELASAHPVARFAAEELRRTLQRLGAPALPIVTQADGPRIVLRHGPGGDAFLRATDHAGMLLRGDGPRGLLYAVYDLLEALGCRWVVPGPAGEFLPRRERVVLPAEGLADRPAIARRSLVLGHDLFLADAEAWIAWAAQNRLNTIFVHTIGHGPAIGACRLATWRRRRRVLLPRLTERGLDLELGGHHLRDLLPRRLFTTQPDLFRVADGYRTPDHNFCPSNPQSLALLRQHATAFFQTYPEAQVYHLWPDDLLSGGWCACPSCASLSPSDQSLLAANALAEALAALRPTASVSFLAYHTTEAAPQVVRPHAQVELLFAPRPRSYAQGLGDPQSRLNPVYATQMAEQRAAMGGPVAVFDYYLDAILFKSALPPLAQVIAADMRYYRSQGVAAVHALMTGDRPWLAAPINAYLFARLAWNPEHDPAALLATYAEVRAPRSPAALQRVYTTLEHAWQAVLDRSPAEAALRREVRNQRDPILAPPLDVLDYMAAARPDCELRLERMGRMQADLLAGQAAWDAVMQSAFADRATLEAERAEWEVAAGVLRFLLLRQQLYVMAARGAERVALQQGLAAAQAGLDHLLAWAQTHVPAAARPGHLLLRTILQLHLDQLADQHIALPWQRATLRARRALLLRNLAGDPRLVWELVRR